MITSPLTEPYIDLSLRIAHPGAELARFQAANALCFSHLGRISFTEDQCVIIISIDTSSLRTLDEILEKGVDAALEVRATLNFPTDASISVWTVISSENEFVGITLQEKSVKRAADARASFVFSLYHQAPTVN